MSNIVSPFQMKENRVVSFGFKQKDLTRECESTKVELGVDYKISDIVEADKTLCAKVDLLIRLVGKTMEDEDSFEISLDMLGYFQGDSGQMDKDRFLNMLKINGISTLMQLSRAYITASTALSGFENPINFPMVNVYELIKMKEDNLKP